MFQFPNVRRLCADFRQAMHEYFRPAAACHDLIYAAEQKLINSGFQHLLHSNRLQDLYQKREEENGFTIEPVHFANFMRRDPADMERVHYVSLVQRLDLKKYQPGNYDVIYATSYQGGFPESAVSAIYLKDFVHSPLPTMQILSDSMAFENIKLSGVARDSAPDRPAFPPGSRFKPGLFESLRA